MFLFPRARAKEDVSTYCVFLKNFLAYLVVKKIQAQEVKNKSEKRKANKRAKIEKRRQSTECLRKRQWKIHSIKNDN